MRTATIQEATSDSHNVCKRGGPVLELAHARIPGLEKGVSEQATELGQGWQYSVRNRGGSCRQTVKQRLVLKINRKGKPVHLNQRTRKFQA